MQKELLHEKSLQENGDVGKTGSFVLLMSPTNLLTYFGGSGIINLRRLDINPSVFRGIDSEGYESKIRSRYQMVYPGKMNVVEYAERK